MIAPPIVFVDTETTGLEPEWTWDEPARAAVEIAMLTANRHLVGAVPSFDAAFLGAFLRTHGLQQAWHYQLIDVETLVAGHLRLAPPWHSRDLALALGIDLGLYRAHQALDDALLAKAMYEAVLGSAGEP